MEKEIKVISLGGSVFISEKINVKFLESFKKIILKNKDRYKFVIVCGGGKIARIYINGLENQKIKDKEYLQCLLGISVTRLNARFLNYFFGKEVNSGLANDMKEIKNLLLKNDFVICGALRYSKNETSDSNAAKLARFFNSDFINITNVSGLYNKDPKKYKDAKLIREISHKDFLRFAKKIKYKPGLHFVLDRKAAFIIKKYKIKTYIIGPDMKNFDNLLNNKNFIGTIIK